MRLRASMGFMKSHRNPKRALGIGVQLPEVERVVRWDELKQMAQTAEAVGFDSIWLGDHLIYRNPGEPPTGPWEVWSTLSALAAVTDTVQLGPLVAATSFHNPAMLAKKAAAVDEISGGRLILGLGAGWNRTEYDAFGFAYDQRVSRFEEAFTIIRKLLAGETLDFHGRFYHLDACQLLPASVNPNGGPPLMIGSTGPRMLGITLPFVEQWNVWYAWFGNRVSGLIEVLENLDAACAKSNRDPSTLERTAALYVQAPGGAGRSRGDEDKTEAPPLAGSVEQVADALIEFADAGIHQVEMVVDPITVESIEWCGGIIDCLDS